MSKKWHLSLFFAFLGMFYEAQVDKTACAISEKKCVTSSLSWRNLGVLHKEIT